MKNRIRRRQAKQSGVVLVTSLILLVLMTLFGLTAVRMITQQERMAGYSYDRGLAFQAAEAALRRAEAAVEELKPTPLSGAACEVVSGSGQEVQICPSPSSSTPMPWTSPTFAGWANSPDVVGTLTLAITPQYFVEYLGNTFPCNFDPSSPASCKRYRITARAGGSGRAAAMVQSMYATD